VITDPPPGPRDNGHFTGEIKFIKRDFPHCFLLYNLSNPNSFNFSGVGIPSLNHFRQA
jgi:hypothetical protein